MSRQIKQLQIAVGTKDDGVFGPNTLKAATKFFNLSPSQAAHFFGQIYVETAGFTCFEENLQYTASRLMQVFPAYFPTRELAEKYARIPESIANRVYANRMGNGEECTGDGWKYRGRGAIQLTGKENYRQFSQFLGSCEPVNLPDCVTTSYAFLAAFWFFGKNGIWEISSHGVTDQVIQKVTRKVNGGVNGLESRAEMTRKYYTMLKSYE